MFLQPVFNKQEIGKITNIILPPPLDNVDYLLIASIVQMFRINKASSLTYSNDTNSYSAFVILI